MFDGEVGEGVARLYLFKRKVRKGFTRSSQGFICLTAKLVKVWQRLLGFIGVIYIKKWIMTENELSKIVFDCALKVHRVLGPGLLESAYEECLYYELTKHNLIVEKQKPLPLVYKEVRLDIGYRVDIIIEHKIILEIKAVEALTDVHFAQLLTYLKLTDCKLGLLINFNVALIKKGIRRVANNL